MNNLDKNSIIFILESNNISVVDEKAVQAGFLMTFNNGSKITFYNNGNYQIQGKNADEIKNILTDYNSNVISLGKTELKDYSKIFTVVDDADIDKMNVPTDNFEIYSNGVNDLRTSFTKAVNESNMSNKDNLISKINSLADSILHNFSTIDKDEIIDDNECPFDL